MTIEEFGCGVSTAIVNKIDAKSSDAVACRSSSRPAAAVFWQRSFPDEISPKIQHYCTGYEFFEARRGGAKDSLSHVTYVRTPFCPKAVFH
jgi:hypothetical protein